MIKKFKNGNIILELNKGWLWDESFYHDEMFMSDLYFNQINGYMYLVDTNTQNVYDFSSKYSKSPLTELEIRIKDGKGKVKLYPLPKREAKSLLQDLENGY